MGFRDKALGNRLGEKCGASEFSSQRIVEITPHPLTFLLRNLEDPLLEMFPLGDVMDDREQQRSAVH